MRFAPGQSGNPAGRPPGSRNRKTIAVEEVLAVTAQETVKLIIARAQSGDPTAMRLCMEQMALIGTDKPLELELPPVRSADDVTAAADAVMKACAEGAISPRQTVCMLTVVERRARIAERALKMKELERSHGGARRKWELDPRMLPTPGPDPDPLEPYLAAIARGEDPFPDDTGAAAGGTEGESLYSPVNSSASADEPADPVAQKPARDPAIDGTDQESLYSPVNLGATADAEETPPRPPAAADPPRGAQGCPGNDSQCRGACPIQPA